MAKTKFNFKFKKDFLSQFRSDIGIDLGTANILVYVRGKGIIINEPSVVSINQKTGRVVAIGNDAKKMLGRTPAHLTAVRPLVDGVISNFEVTEEMLRYFIKKAETEGKLRIKRPRVVIGVPYGITNVERRAVIDAAHNAGAGEVFIIEEPMAAAIGIRLPIHEPVGNMVIDIGGGTTEIAVIALGGIVRAKSLKIAGDRFNNDIISYLKDEFKILLGDKTAEDLKILVGSVHPKGEAAEATVRGRDMITGLPREVVITDADIREAVASSVVTLVESVKEVIESTPPELLSDIIHRGVVIVGGGSLINGLRELLAEELKIPVHTTEEALTAVVKGIGFVLDNVPLYQDILVRDEDELPPSLI
jgi:rod shape-determining protein MreB